MAEIKDITIKIGKKEITLSYGEFTELRTLLNTLPVNIPTIFPAYPTYPTITYYTLKSGSASGSWDLPEKKGE